MTVSKPGDEHSRVPAPGGDVDVTPPPPRTTNAYRGDGDSGKVRDGTGPRRVIRSGVTRERSGPIAISNGDFATPMVRKRTTTRPRGTPLNQSTPPPIVDTPPPVVLPELDLVAAPAEPLAAAAPAEPVAAVAPPELTPPPSRPIADDSPFVAPADVPGAWPNEAAALAAEAAAVRAFDSGPLTPPPTPSAAFEQAAQPTPGVEVNVATPLPALQVADAPSPLIGDAATAIRHAASSPALDIPAPDAMPPVSPLEQAIAAAEGALPMDSIRADAAAGSAVSVFSVETEAEADIPSEEDVEVVDGADATPAPDPAMAGAAALAVETPPSRPPPLRAKTPPPIPGSFLKTPGPELLPGASPSAGAASTAPVADNNAPPILPALAILPEALTQRPPRPKRSKPWFEEVFDEDYLRTLPFMRADQTLREVEFISQTLHVDAGAEILDVGCGYGRHAIELVQRGFNVTGLDLSLPLLIRAADEAQRRDLAVNFVHADMREMAFERQFDGAYSMMTTFGYFDEESNLRVAEGIARALKPGARLLLDLVNRDYVVADLPARVWWEGTGCVVLEEVDFNFHTSRIMTHRSIVFEDGRQLEQEISVRAYSLHEIGRLLRQAGFRVIDVSGSLVTRGQFLGSTSRSLLVVAEKREGDG